MAGIILLIIILVLIAAALIGGAVCFHLVIGRVPSRNEYEVPEFYEAYKDRYLAGLDFLKKHPYKEYTIQSRDGLKLVGFCIDNPDAVRTLILCHGYHGAPIIDFGAALPFYYESGCRILLINERSQQKSEGKYIAFGMKEGGDIADWAHFMNTLPGIGEQPMYFGGISMGASSVMMSTFENLPENVHGIIADCGFSDPWKQIVITAKKIHILAFPFLYVLNFYCRILGHFNFFGRTPEEAMRQNRKIPMLFIHGTADDLVLPSNSVRDYEACSAPKHICLIEDATHAISYMVDTPKYEAAVKDFFAETASPIQIKS